MLTQPVAKTLTQIRAAIRGMAFKSGDRNMGIYQAMTTVLDGHILRIFNVFALIAS
jgi:hypothetical protein